MRCNIIDQNTAIILDSHVYDPRSGELLDVRCDVCGCCKRHCSGFNCPACQSSVHSACTFCGKCSACCQCIICKGSDAHVLSSEWERCLGCKRCAEHCTCPKCPSCSARSLTFCKFCKQCAGCCNGEASECGAFGRQSPIDYTKDKKKVRKWVPNRKQLKLLPNPRLIGVEVEVNSLTSDGLKRPRKLWNAITKWDDAVVQDGSIGDLPSAFEINMQPSGGDLFVQHLKEITDGLAAMKAKPNDSCGVHVHIDADGFEVYDLNRIIRLYAKVERAMFDLCHPSRLNNRYSIPCGKYYVEQGVKADPAEFRQNLVSKLYYEGVNVKDLSAIKEKYCAYNFGRTYADARKNEKESTDKNAIKNLSETLKKEKQHKYRNVRYKALNLHSYFLRRTIEFRHHEKSVSFDELMGWATTCQELVSCSYRMTQRQIDALPRNARRTLVTLMPERLHPYLIQTWKKNDAIRKGRADYTDAYNHQWETR